MSRHPVVRRVNKWTRRIHRWGAVLTAVPLVFVICTGILLQVKKQAPWVQPPTQRGAARTPELTFEAMLDAVRAVPEAQVRSWADVERVDVQVGRGLAKVICKSRWEVQIDTRSGEVLQVAYRRSDLIESLHDGSFFGQLVKLGVFLPTAIVLLCLWTTGVYLWILPNIARRSGRRRRAETAAMRPGPGMYS
jgi:uncharacterized iron-regulated membrane protein